MASLVPSLKYLQNVVFLLLVTNILPSLSEEYSGILSNLYKKASDQNRPLILVLDNNANRNSNYNDLESQSSNYKSSNYQSDYQSNRNDNSNSYKKEYQSNSYNSPGNNNYKSSSYSNRNDRLNSYDNDRKDDDKYPFLNLYQLTQQLKDKLSDDRKPKSYNSNSHSSYYHQNDRENRNRNYNADRNSYSNKRYKEDRSNNHNRAIEETTITIEETTITITIEEITITIEETTIIEQVTELITIIRKATEIITIIEETTITIEVTAIIEQTTEETTTTITIEETTIIEQATELIAIIRKATEIITTIEETTITIEVTAIIEQTTELIAIIRKATDLITTTEETTITITIEVTTIIEQTTEVIAIIRKATDLITTIEETTITEQTTELTAIIRKATDLITTIEETTITIIIEETTITIEMHQDGKKDPPQPAGTSEDGSSTPVGTAPSSGPSTVTGASTTTGSTPPATGHFGISMVHGPPIVLGLSDVPSVSSTPSSRAPSPVPGDGMLASATALAGRSATLSSRLRLTRTSGSMVQFRRYSGTTQSTMQRKDPNESSSDSSAFSLNKEVEEYVRKRDASHIYEYYPGTERTVYDYVAERNDMYNTNLVEATAHLIKGSLGAAVLSMHEGYMYGGLWTSVVVTVVIGVLIGYTMYMLIRSAQKMYRRLRIHKLSYPDLAEAAAATAPWTWVRKKSKAFRYTVEIILFLQMCGICCIYHIVIAHTIRQIINSFEIDVPSSFIDIRMYILCTTPLLLPLCLIRSLKLLAPFAMIADIFVALCVCTTIYFSISLALEVTLDQRAAWKDMHGFIRICGLSMYGTSGVCVALPVENNMKQPIYFPRVVQFATAIVIILTVATGFFGYWAWGETCTSPITVHLPNNA
ncbi:hypothetical protein PYW07_010834 [Mythimna separata]|uniref:Amino acid transporter transmembrane domain-containing protein n=1 Tax=Mythimna separata TaxID=271217 RepID=A0AAD7Y899_MYTSE|nr:hypothetical protein PYW07_010834 [Mythimna separata]